jgi:hypothetical protein
MSWDQNQYEEVRAITTKELGLDAVVIFDISVADPGSGAFLTPGSGIGFYRLLDPGSRT